MQLKMKILCKIFKKTRVNETKPKSIEKYHHEIANRNMENRRSEALVELNILMYTTITDFDTVIDIV